MSKKRTGSSRRWLQEHHADPYVAQAKSEGYRGRAAFKLIEIQKKDRILKPGQAIVDLGAAPGSWSQVAAAILGDKGRIIAIDLLKMDSIAGVEDWQGDFTDTEILNGLLESAGDHCVDVVLSDMAPNLSGNRSIDQPRSMVLVETALYFCQQTLKPGGHFLCKVFQGDGFDVFLKDMRQAFEKVASRKPEASRGRSRELYLLGKGFRGHGE